MAVTTIPSAGLTLGAQVNFRNILINGDMSIAQRGTSTSGITGGGYHACDRWSIALSVGGTWTQSQSTDVPTGQGFTKSTKFACTTANASLSAGSYLSIRQRIEGQMVQHLKKGTSNAESVTLSFWVKSNKTGTYQTNIRDMDNSRLIGQTYTINSANTWEKKTLTFVGDTTGTFDNDNNDSMRVEWFLVAGSSNTGGSVPTSWQTSVEADRAAGLTVNLADSTSNEWYITGVQLEVGTSASDFEFLPHDVNLRRCQRYYEILGYDTGNGNAIASAMKRATTVAQGSWVFRVDKRTNPTLSYIGSVSDFRVHDVNGGNLTGSSISGNGTPGKTSVWIGLNLTSAGLDQTPCLIYINSGGAGYTADAEL
jgi:hypothetical protein